MYRFELPPVAVRYVDGKISVKEITQPLPARPSTVAELLAKRKQVEQQNSCIVRDKSGERVDLKAIDIEIAALISKGK